MEHSFILIKNFFFREAFIFIAAIVLVVFFIKKLIHISHLKHLFDEPTEARKIHKIKTPNLGGVAIAGTMILISCLFINTGSVPAFNSIFFAILILLLTGISDDLIGTKPFKKLIIQAIASSLVAFFGCRFTSFYGFFGWNEVPYWASFAGSTFFILFVINAFNLIDGINCLAGGIGLLASACFAFYFWQMNDKIFTSFAIAICGSLVAFLWFNKSPARIFMGDTGSMFIGFIISLFSIHLLQLSLSQSSPLPSSQIVSLVTALLIIPVYDTIRVFILRIAHSQSPFTADRNHIHHRLIDLGLSHMQASGLLIIINIFFVFLAILIRSFRPEFFVLATFTLLTAFNGVLSILHITKQKVLLIENRLPEPNIRVIISKKSIMNV